MDFQDLISRFAVALGIGLLIGLERGWRTREERAGSRTAGIRTFAISGILGGIIGGLSQALGGPAGTGGGIVMGLGFAVYAAAMAMFCREENRANKSFSATTAVAAMVTFALGAYALAGDMRAAAAVAVATAVILALRESIHGWVANITWSELRSGLVLLAMTFIALPIVPEGPIGPYGGVNLREVWIIAIVLAGVSFIGYAAVKYFGAKHGILLAGAAGGLASSTAVTITNARRAASLEGPPRLLAAGVALASAMMFLRVCVIVAVLNASLLVWIAPALIAATVVATGFALISVYWGGPGAKEVQDIQFHNPFSFRSVVGFALFLGFVIVVGRALGETFGATGAILGATVVGIVDVDAITISMARLTPQPLSALSAALAILAAVASDTISKIVIGAIVGCGRFAAQIAAMALGCFVAAGIVLWTTFTLLA
ncbi:MAG: DUF4010 domain-containing protein [Xanthobacteraceae bacterium]